MFFKPTEEEIKAAQGGKLPFKNGEDYTFLFENLGEKTDEKGEQVLQLKSKILGGHLDGSMHTFFLRPGNAYDRSTMMSITDHYVKREELANSGFSFATCIGDKFKSKCKLNAKGYANFYTFDKVSNTPDVGGSSVSANDVPF